MKFPIDPAIPGPHHQLGIFPLPWYFAEGSGSEGGGGNSNSGDGGGNTDPEDNGGEDDDSGNSSDEEPKFTQKQVNDLISKSKDKATRGLLNPKELGFNSRKEMEAFIEAKKAEEKTKQTDDEKALEKAKEDAANAAKAEVLSKAQVIARKAEFKVQARDAGIPADRINDAYLLAQSLEEFEAVEVDDDGNVTGFDEDFFKSLKESKSFLFVEEEGEEGTNLPPGAGQRAGGGKGDKTREADLKSKFPALNQA